MSRKRIATKLHLLKVLEVQNAPEGDTSDGGGLMLRVRGQSASWVLRYTVVGGGRRREMGLGIAHRASGKQAGESLTTARELAHNARELLRRDVDPIDERDARIAGEREAKQAKKADQAREQMTLARAARNYHERVIEPSRTSKHAAQWIASLEHHVPPDTWHKAIDDIEPPELLAALSGVRSLADEKVHVPETLSRVRQRLDAVFEDAIFHKRCSSNPAAAIRRKMRETQSRRERGQFAALPYREVPAFVRDVRQQPGIAARCLEFALLTASRTNEVLLATWPEVDVDAGVWLIPAERMKGGEAHTVHLSEPAKAVLQAQRELGSAYLFPSPRDLKQPLSNMAMLTLIERMGMNERTTVHGVCRASFSTWANETAAARPDVVEACLAHREADRVKAAYNRAKFTEERRALMIAWAAYITRTGEVIEFKAA